MLIFDKALNNNIALTIDESGTEVIVVSTGIGFHGKKGIRIDESSIDKAYRMTRNEKISRFLEEIPVDIIETTELIIQEGTNIIEKELNTSILLTLSDHIKFSIERVNKGVSIFNPLKWEIPHLYPKEYQAGKRALEIVEERLKVVLPEDEAAYIALHFVNGQYESQSMVKTMEASEAIKTIIDIVNYNFHIELTEKNLGDSRFITHLHYLIIRQNQKKPHTPLINESLFSIIQQDYVRSYLCACKIKDFLMKRYQWDINEDEVIYLVIHIEKIVSGYEMQK